MTQETAKNAFRRKGVQGSAIVIMTAIIAIIRSWHDGGFNENELIPAIFMLGGGVHALWGRWTARQSVKMPKLGSGCLLLCLLVMMSLAGCGPMVQMDTDLQDRVIEVYNDSMATVAYCDTGQTQMTDACDMLAEQREVLGSLYTTAELRPAVKANILGCMDITDGYLHHCNMGTLTIEEACKGIELNARALKAVLEGQALGN
jgi:hypothetical protein